MSISPFSSPVWGYLEDGLAEAKEEVEEMAQLVPSNEWTRVNTLISIIIASHQQLAFPERAPISLDLVTAAHTDPILGQLIDLRIGDEAIDRVRDWRKRLALLAPATVARMADEKVREYVAEATTTFLWGFDVAAIALCRASLEQIVKEVYVRRGLGSWDEVRRSTTPLSQRIAIIKSLKPAVVSSQGAKRLDYLKRLGNEMLHRSLKPKRIRPQTAADTISALTDVIGEVYGRAEADV